MVNDKDRYWIKAFAGFADRCHVGMTNEEVLEDAKSRLKDGYWDLLDEDFQNKAKEALFEKRGENQALYRRVMLGIR